MSNRHIKLHTFLPFHLYFIPCLLMSVLGNRSFSIVRTEACHHLCSGSNCYHLRSARSELALSWECLWNLKTTQPLDTLVWTLVHSPLHYSDSLYTALLGLWSTSNSASSLVLLHCMWSLRKFVSVTQEGLRLHLLFQNAISIPPTMLPDFYLHTESIFFLAFSPPSPPSHTSKLPSSMIPIL